MATIVLAMTPSIAIISKSFGIATISFDFSTTFTCPRTNRCRVAKAETIWIAAFTPFMSAERRTVLPSLAITSAATPDRAAT